MTHEAKDQRHDLSNYGHVGRQYKEAWVVDGITSVILVNPRQEAGTDDFYTVKNCAERQRYSQEDSCCDHQASMLAPKVWKVSLELGQYDDPHD